LTIFCCCCFANKTKTTIWKNQNKNTGLFINCMDFVVVRTKICKKLNLYFFRVLGPYPNPKFQLICLKIIEAMKKTLQEAKHDEMNRGSVYYNFRRKHINVWQSIWETGFEITTSKAENALNGNRINATQCMQCCLRCSRMSLKS
jgi:hypothetical protein